MFCGNAFILPIRARLNINLKRSSKFLSLRMDQTFITGSHSGIDLMHTVFCRSQTAHVIYKAISPPNIEYRHATIDPSWMRISIAACNEQ